LCSRNYHFGEGHRAAPDQALPAALKKNLPEPVIPCTVLSERDARHATPFTLATVVYSKNAIPAR
jgi:hypothetical protein